MASVTVGWRYTAYSDVDRILLCRATTLDKESLFEYYLNEDIREPFLSVIHDEPASNFVDGQDYTFIDHTAADDELYFYCIAVKGPGALGAYKVGTAAAASDTVVTLDTPLGTSAVNRILTLANSGSVNPDNVLPLYCNTEWEPFRAFAGLDANGNLQEFPSSVNSTRYIDYSRRIGIPDIGGIPSRPVPAVLQEVTWKYNSQNPRTPYPYYLGDGTNSLETAIFPLVNTNASSSGNNWKVRCTWALTECTDTYAEYKLYTAGTSGKSILTDNGTLPTSRIVVDPDDPTKNMFVGLSDSNVTQVTYKFNTFHGPVHWYDVGNTTNEATFDSTRKYMTNYNVEDVIPEPDGNLDLSDANNFPYYRSLFTGSWSGDDNYGNYVDPRATRRQYAVWGDYQTAGLGSSDLRSFTVSGGPIHACNV